MAKKTEERRLSEALERCMDRLSFMPESVVIQFDLLNENMQNRMMDLIMSFLTHWQNGYREGIHREGEIMHRIGSMADKMLGALYDS